MSEGNFPWKEAESVFLQAVDLEGEARERFVREHCAGNPALHEAVGRLLAFDTTAEIPSNAPMPTDGDDWTGSQIGSYQILSRIGSGGMGTVFKAERQDSFRKTVLLRCCVST